MRRLHSRVISLDVAGLCAAAIGAALVLAPRTAAAAPFFTEVPNAFGTQACAGSGCWTNYLRVSDIDGDADLDVLFPNANGFFMQAGSEAEQPFVIYQNDGNAAFTNVSAAAVGGFSNWLRQIAIGDIDGDSDPDIYAPAAWGNADAFFINNGSGVFANEAAARLPINSHAGAARFGDVDNDGDLDLLLSDGWAQSAPAPAHLYLNNGQGVFAEAPAGQLPASLEGNDPIDFDLFDVDRDFDLDLLIDVHQGKNALWINDGTGKFTDATADMPGPGSNHFHYGPVTCDVDGDGDLDIWVDNIGPVDFTEQLLINDGTGKFTDESEARIDGNPGADDNGLACIDVDGDGDLDAAIMSLGANERVLINDGTGNFTLPENGFPTLSDGTLWFEFGDLNGDGRLDVVTGQGESSTLDRVYLGNDNTPVDIRPPVFIKVEQAPNVMPGEVNVVRFAVSDNATTDEGPRLRDVYVTITSTTSGDIPARFMGGDLFRAELPALAGPGQVTYTACATDMAGNNACSTPLTYEVGDAGPTTGSGGSTGVSMTGSGGAAGSTGSNGGAGGDDFEVDDDGGCGCEMPGANRNSARLGLGLGLAAAALLLGQRRRSRRLASRNR